MQKISIKCFQTLKSYYCYVRYRDSIIRVTQKEYEELLKVESGTLDYENSITIKKYICQDIIGKNITKKIEHPQLINLNYMLENNMNQLILQVTQQCNFRCDYCVYSGKYKSRKHNNKKMNLTTAKKAIDFYVAHSRNKNEFTVGFYGGEPLLEFKLIKECINYCEQLQTNKLFSYSMTTNGSLLTKEITDFLVEHNFNIMISFDGPKEVHNAKRVFVSGKGSFDIIMNNITYLKKKYKKYYESNVIFNTVISPNIDINSIYSFFSENDIFLINQNRINIMNPFGLKDSNDYSFTKEFDRTEKYSRLKLYLTMLGKLDWNKETSLLYEEASRITRLYWDLKRHAIETEKSHHSGPCMPGVRRLFVTADGSFYPCERVSECSAQMNIGSLEKGFDYQKIEMFLNHGRIIENECLNCWNLRRCSFCLGNVEMNGDDLTSENLLQKCKFSKINTLRELSELCVLAELGCKFPKEVKS